MADYQLLLSGLRERHGFDFAALSLVPAGERPVLTWQYASGNLNNRFRRIVLASGLGILGIVYRSASPLLLSDVNSEIPHQDMFQYPIIIGEGLGSLCAVPLFGAEGICAIILAAYRYVGGMTAEKLAALLAELARDGFAGFYPQDEQVALAQTSISGLGDASAAARRPVYEDLAQRLLAAQEDERRRLSRELHDGIVQELLGAQIQLRQTRYAASAEQREALVDVSLATMDHILGELRRMAADLRPSALDSLGLEAALLNQASRSGDAFGVRVHLESSIGSARFAPHLETAFYRICQEALVNSCKHSGAEDVHIRLWEERGCLNLSVADAGCGFAPVATGADDAAGGAGLGLGGMRERAELIDAELGIESAPGKGCKVWLRTALDNEQAVT